MSLYEKSACCIDKKQHSAVESADGTAGSAEITAEGEFSTFCETLRSPDRTAEGE